MEKAEKEKKILDKVVAIDCRKDRQFTTEFKALKQRSQQNFHQKRKRYDDDMHSFEPKRD